MAKTLLITGASGNVGKAVLTALASHAGALDVRAGVRNPAKPEAADLAKLGSNISVVAADPLNKEEIGKALEGVDYLFIIPPSSENRKEISIAAIDAGKAAGVKFLLVLSVATADLTDTIFGAQFAPVEAHVKASGIPYAIFRVPNFLDNAYGYIGSIKGQGAFYGSFLPDKENTQVAIKDIAAISAKILSDPTPHTGKSYCINSPPFTHTQLAAAFSETLGKPVNYVHIPYESTKGFLTSIGFPDWQADGVVELCRLVNEDSPTTNNPQGAKDVEAILGRPATTAADWVKEAAPAFQ